MGLLAKYGVVAIARVVSWLPASALYALSELLWRTLYYVVRYRKEVVRQNLQRAFPGKEPHGYDALCRAFYRHFADIVLESLAALYWPAAYLERRFTYRNPELFDKHLTAGKSIALLGSHFGNWEWGVLSFPRAVSVPVIGIYKPLSHTSLDAWLNSRRCRWGLNLVPMQLAARAVATNHTRPAVFVFIADQTPVDVRHAVWLPFMNQPTPFFRGPAKLARRYDMPVYAVEIHRKMRGYYEVVFTPLCLEPRQYTEEEIIRRYAEHLAGLIALKPPHWLWSHRRWKRSPPRIEEPRN